MRAVNKLSTILALGLAMLLFRIGPASAAAFDVWISTSGLSGDALMAFDFTNSDPGSEHQLVISDFAPEGALNVSAKLDPENCPLSVFPFTVDACKDPPDSSVTGTLGWNPPVTILDAGPSGNPITYYQRINLTGASYISFSFEMSSVLTPIGVLQDDSGTPDGFAFWLYDLNGTELVPGPLILYTFGQTCDPIEACTEVRVPGVPEPTPLALTIAALLALISARRPASALHRRRAVRA